MEYQSYVIIYVLYLAVILAVSIYVYRLRKLIDEMHGMMIGMTFGMIAGLITATLFLIPTGNFLYGFIIGSIIGLFFGVPFGKLGGHLGIMEGTIAGPMGGMMGAMLGQMIRPFSIEIFMPFFTFIFLIMIVGIAYAVNCRVRCCNTEKNRVKNKISNKIILFWSLVIIFLLTASVILSFSINTNSKTNLKSSNAQQDNQNLRLPPYLQELTKEDIKETVIKGNYQEIDLQITASKYSPNVIIAKKNIPLKINLYAAENAGCAREIIFPDFNVDKIVPAGGKETIEINPTEAGEFKFRCSMDMVKGKLIIK
ncbi:cupredoxin domain-containing protein [Candidatus Woesearchaeota archaeon]|nr:cupredoxin domain-containing protein [Candidatus Woesearchaeota archaeon]